MANPIDDLVPVPLSLGELPVFGTPGGGGLFQEVRVEYEDAHYSFGIQAHRDHGYPTHSDELWFLALLRYGDDLNGWEHGHLDYVPIERLAALVDRNELGGSKKANCRAALERIAGLRLSARFIASPEQLPLKIRDAVHPLVPLRNRVIDPVTNSTRLVSILSLETVEYRPGFIGIANVKIEEPFLWQFRRFAAWIDLPTYASIHGKQAQARRLYSILTSRVTRNPAENELRYRQAELVSLLCPTGSDQPRSIRRSIEELVRAKVVESFEVVGRGQKSVYILKPGERLRATQVMVGAGGMDIPSLRRAWFYLREIMVSAPVARRMIQESPGRVQETIEYHRWCAEHRQREIEDPPAFFVHLMKHGDVGQNDALYQVERLRPSAPRARLSAPAEVAPQFSAQPPLPGGAAEAVELWQDTFPQVNRLLLEHESAGWKIEDGVLHVWVRRGAVFPYGKPERRQQVNDAVCAASGGDVLEVAWHVPEEGQAAQ